MDVGNARGPHTRGSRSARVRRLYCARAAASAVAACLVEMNEGSASGAFVIWTQPKMKIYFYLMCLDPDQSAKISIHRLIVSTFKVVFTYFCDYDRVDIFVSDCTHK